MATKRTDEEKKRRGRKKKGATRAATKAETPRAPGQRQGPETLGQNLKKRMSGKTLSPETIKENTFARQPDQKIDWSKGGGKGARPAAKRAANAGKAAARGMAGQLKTRPGFGRSLLRGAGRIAGGTARLGLAAPALAKPAAALLGGYTIYEGGRALGRGLGELSTGANPLVPGVDRRGRKTGGAAIDFSRNILNAASLGYGLGDWYTKYMGFPGAAQGTAEAAPSPRPGQISFGPRAASAATPGANPAALGQAEGVRDRPGSAQTVNAAPVASFIGPLPNAATAQHTRGQTFYNEKTGQWKVFDGMEYADFDPEKETPEDVLAETEERWFRVRDKETGAVYPKSNRGITNIDGAYFGGIPQDAVRRGFDQAGLDKYRRGPVVMGDDEITMTMGEDGVPLFKNRKLGAAALGGGDRTAMMRQQALERLDELLNSVSYNADPGAYAEEMAGLQNILTMTQTKARDKNDFIVINEPDRMDGGQRIIDSRTMQDVTPGEQPPVPGARRAPNGKWYKQRDDGGFDEVGPD